MDVILKVILLQAAVILPVIIILRVLLERELVRAAIEGIRGVAAVSGQAEVDPIRVISARRLSESFRMALEQALEARFRQAKVVFLENKDLQGGVIVQAGQTILDYSLAMRWEMLFNRGEECP